ncbi:MAG: sigma-70 family RNA polymerase sigma factor [Planctomycetales bacterium]|nr:sigma-70 family RNA polymerase sigma factor [Planctomycetales bacterium]
MLPPDSHPSPPNRGQPASREQINEWVVAHLPAALRFAVKLTNDGNLAEEIVQEALCRVLDKWRGFRQESSFQTWLFQIVLNVERDRRRSPRRASQIAPDSLPTQQQAPDETLAVREMHAALRKAIAELPDRQREVAVLCLGEGLSRSEAAEVLGVTENNVNTCLHYARQHLARRLRIDVAVRTPPNRREAT